MWLLPGTFETTPGQTRLIDENQTIFATCVFENNNKIIKK